LEVIVSLYMKIQPNKMLQVNDMIHLGNIRGVSFVIYMT
jgi:hypothetical protein